MDYNHIINRLKLWCIQNAKRYQKAYGAHGGIAYVGYQLSYELEFKLSMLMDKSYESADAMKQDIAALMDVHYEPSVQHPQNSTARQIIDKTNRAFLAFLEEVLSGGDALPPAEIPYARVIVGDEAASLIDRFRSVWGYVNTSFWFPLLGEAPEAISEKFFIMYEYCEPYMRQLEQIIGLPQEHIYSYGENAFYPEFCFETAELIAYSGYETMFTDKGFTWAIYFSHENTVSFAGSIVQKAKNLLMAEEARWDKYEWNCDDA